MTHAAHRAEDHRPTPLGQRLTSHPHLAENVETGVPLIRIVIGLTLAFWLCVGLYATTAPADPPEPVPAAQTVAMPRCTPQVEELAVREHGQVLPAAVRRAGR